MVRVIPGAARVIFSNTGSEAVQAALRLARGFTGRDKVVKFEGHYYARILTLALAPAFQPR